MGETYSARNYPRSCNPNNNYVLYLYKGSTRVGGYGFIGWQGFGFNGKAGEKLPKGDYTLYLINQSYKTKVADITLSFYWADDKGTVKAK